MDPLTSKSVDLHSNSPPSIPKGKAFLASKTKFAKGLGFTALGIAGVLGGISTAVVGTVVGLGLSTQNPLLGVPTIFGGICLGMFCIGAGIQSFKYGVRTMNAAKATSAVSQPEQTLLEIHRDVQVKSSDAPPDKSQREKGLNFLRGLLSREINAAAGQDLPRGPIHDAYDKFLEDQAPSDWYRIENPSANEVHAVGTLNENPSKKIEDYQMDENGTLQIKFRSPFMKIVDKPEDFGMFDQQKLWLYMSYLCEVHNDLFIEPYADNYPFSMASLALDLENHLDQTDKRYIGYQIEFQDHWTLVLVDREKCTIEYYDSKSDHGNPEQIQQDLKRAAETAGAKEGKPYTVVKKINNSIQADPMHCGPWVLNMLQKRLENPDVDFSEFAMDPLEAEDFPTIEAYFAAEKKRIADSPMTPFREEVLRKLNALQIVAYASENLHIEASILHPDPINA